MLSQLYIENIAVIQKATIQLEGGFNVFTGETGAGKTILISAINAVLGARTSRGIIRSGESRAVVSALFTSIPEEVARQVEELGYTVEEGQLMVHRELDAGGNGSCRVNGRPATTGLLRQISSLLIDIHGQRDSQELLSAEKHMAFVDGFGGLEEEVAAYRGVYQKLQQAREKLDSLQMDESYKLQRQDLLQYQLGEIEAAALSPGEEEELLSQRDIIRNAETITGALGSGYQLLTGGDEGIGIVSALGSLGEELDTICRFVEGMEEYQGKVQDLRYDLEELAALARDRQLDVRFIELMPVGMGAALTPIPGEEVRQRLEAAFGPMEPYQGAPRGNGPAVYYSLPGFTGKIGFISAVSHRFCGDCNRVRLTSTGFLKLCLHYSDGVPLRELVRSGAGEEELARVMAKAIRDKPLHHDFGGKESAGWDRHIMSQIGG